MATRRNSWPGGQSLIPAMNFRLARPAMLIDINRMADALQASRPGRRRSASARSRATVRSSATLAFRGGLPLIVEALPHIAHPQIRNRGTHRRQSRPMPIRHPSCRRSRVALAGAAARSSRPAASDGSRPPTFLSGALTTDLAADEMLVGDRVAACKPAHRQLFHGNGPPPRRFCDRRRGGDR